jgi:4-alpha-glucanotransferase
MGDGYLDYLGHWVSSSSESKALILRAMGFLPTDERALEAECRRLDALQWGTLAPKIATAHGHPLRIELNVPVAFAGKLHWAVTIESGGRHEGIVLTADCPEVSRGSSDGASISRRSFELPVDLPPGYHELQITADGKSAGCSLIVAPPLCYEPPAILAGKPLWGVALQLYAIRSRGNWGIGDFSDLAEVIRWLAPHGAAFVGLNPLHALAPADPSRSSPYSPSSRHFLNILYISVTDIPEYHDCEAAIASVNEPTFQAELGRLRLAPLVQYEGVAAAKIAILRLLFLEFGKRHIAPGTQRASLFHHFVTEGGALLQSHARFDALDQHFRSTLKVQSGWSNWPVEFRDPHGAAVSAFAVSHDQDVSFYAYLQWLAHEQLQSVTVLASVLGMPIGLYGDCAVGPHPCGSETWSDRAGYCMSAEIGAPPDSLGPAGQGWGIPPPDPAVMLSRGLTGFIHRIRTNVRYYGSLRLDHVMSLYRLWWMTAGHSPTEGIYVHYPLPALLAVVALESVRNSCLLIGENLGVVPAAIRRAIPEYGLYEYKVVLFEKGDHGKFRRPQDLARRAIGTITTHDTPTLRGFWENQDIDLRQRLGRYSNLVRYQDSERDRAGDKAGLLAALRLQDLQPTHPASAQEPYSQDLAHAMHLYLARSNTTLIAVQLHDLLGMSDPVNVPGTDREYPNWRRKIPMELEALTHCPNLTTVFAEIARARSEATH